MRKLFFLLIMWGTAFNVCNAQNIIKVKGKILNAESVDNIYLGSGAMSAVEVLDDNTYSIELDVPVLPAKISFSNINFKTGMLTNLTPDLWVESSDVEVNFDASKKNEYKIIPSVAYQTLSEKIQYADKNNRKELIAQNSNSFPALYFLYSDYFFKENKDLVFLEDVLAGLDQDYKESYYGRLLDTFLKAKKEIPAKKGKKLISLELFNADLKSMNLIEQNGKTKIICYTSTECGYSSPTIAFLAELNEKINKDTYEIITVWDDSSYEVWQNHRPEIKDAIKWNNLWDKYRFVSVYMNIDTTPTFFVVDQNGVLVKEMKGISSKTKKKIVKMCK